MTNSGYNHTQTLTGLPNFLRAIVIRVKALENENYIVTRGPTLVGPEGRFFYFRRSRMLENAFLRLSFALILQCKYRWYYVILLKFEKTDLFSVAVSQKQINLTNRLKTNANFLSFRGISKPYTSSLSDFNTVNTANHKGQFHKQCKCQK